MQATPGGGSLQTQAHVGPEAQFWVPLRSSLGGSTFLDGPGELCLAKGGGWPLGEPPLLLTVALVKKDSAAGHFLCMS